MGAMASQITSVTIVYSTIYSGADQRKYQSSAALAFVPGTGEFSVHMASNAENVSIWWRHHDVLQRVQTHCWHHYFKRVHIIFMKNSLDKYYDDRMGHIFMTHWKLIRIIPYTPWTNRP